MQEAFNLCACSRNMDTGATRLVFDHELYKNQVIACERKENTLGIQANTHQQAEYKSNCENGSWI